MSSNEAASLSLKNVVIQDRFHIQMKVGEGSFGSVYFAIDRKNNRPVAIKTENQQQK